MPVISTAMIIAVSGVRNRAPMLAAMPATRQTAWKSGSIGVTSRSKAVDEALPGQARRRASAGTISPPGAPVA